MALRRHPGCPPHVRLGIAFCHFHLGRPKLAEAAFNRTIALDPHCSSAYIGLAVLSLNSGTKQVKLVVYFSLDLILSRSQCIHWPYLDHDTFVSFTISQVEGIVQSSVTFCALSVWPGHADLAALHWGGK